MWDHTLLPATRHRSKQAALTPTIQASNTHLTSRDGRVTTRVVYIAKIVYLYAVTHPSGNRAQWRLLLKKLWSKKILPRNWTPFPQLFSRISFLLLPDNGLDALRAAFLLCHWLAELWVLCRWNRHQFVWSYRSTVHVVNWPVSRTRAAVWLWATSHDSDNLISCPARPAVFYAFA